MAAHTFRGKQRLCYTEVNDFTDFQGIGHDPLYRRYDSVLSVVKKVVPQHLWHFLATPDYLEDSDQICWYVDQWDERPTRLSELSGQELDEYQELLKHTVEAYKMAASKLDGDDLQIMAGAIKYADSGQVYCGDGKVYLVAWGMKPATHRHKVIGTVIHDYDYVKKFKVRFDAGAHGSIAPLDRTVSLAGGTTLTETEVPQVTVHEGWTLTGWLPDMPVGQVVNADMAFTAQYDQCPPPVPPHVEDCAPDAGEENDGADDDYKEEDTCYNCRFEAGEHGTLNGPATLHKTAGSTIGSNEVPAVTPHKGYRFTGWSSSPINVAVDGDKVFVAQYERVVPWYKRWWLWLTGSGCLKWLLWLLLALLLGLLLIGVLKGCEGCTGHHTPVNGVVPADTMTRADGSMVDDNGYARPVTGDDGQLPDDEMIVAPVMGEGGSEPPIVEQPGAPSIMANRLFLFMEEENDNVEALARDFKRAYPGEQYGIIGYDKEVKLLVIQVPEAERNHIRQTINRRISGHKFIVFDEEVYELNGQASTQSEPAGWHLGAIHLKQGWACTKGSANVKVAIVDDGIQAGHPMFKGRIVDAYNVFTQNNTLSMGEGHGTHTAALAAGSADYYNRGASGVAPGCQIMPIQVFDNKRCPLSALVAGVMYALHHNADVVNISIGPSFKGLNVLPVEQQAEIARTQFRNVALLWARVCQLAARKRAILVFAAGNDDILTSIPPENRNASSIVVTAVDPRLCPTSFTNYGPGSDISAPGKGISSAFPVNTFKMLDGTSMAAPIVTGTIALMKSLKKDLTVAQARNVLYRTGAAVYGNIPPMVLVDKALEAVRQGNFSAPAERAITPVPGGAGAGGSSQANPIASPAGNMPPPTTATPQPAGGTDYDAIRRKIAAYKQKIEELEKLLPHK